MLSWAGAALGGAALAALLGTVSAAPGDPRSVEWTALPAPVQRWLTARDLPADRFAAWRDQARADTQRRIREGDEDHLIAFGLQSRTFTILRPIEPALSAKAFVEGGAIPEDAAARLGALSIALRGSSPEPHLVAFRALGRNRHELDTMYRRFMTQLYEQEFRAPATREARAAVYQRRGLSTDSAVEAGFGVRTGLALLRELQPGRRVRRVAIVGPGLEIGPRTGLQDVPPQSPQPFAVIDALLALDLARLDDLEVVCLDVNPRVVDHLGRARGAPPRLSLRSALAGADGVALDAGYHAYLAALGSRVGAARAVDGDRVVDVSTAAADSLRPMRLDIVVERMDLDADLVVVTNVLPYFDDRQLAVALTNLAALLAPDGVLLHNEARSAMHELSQAAGLPLWQGRTVTIAQVAGAAPLYDTVWLHRRAPVAAAMTPPAAAERPHLALALDAARWLRTAAVETPDGLVWPADPGDPRSVQADLYSGSAGVVLFFLELHRATGDAAHLAGATRGADALLAAVDRERDPGLYTGLAGIGFALAEAGRHAGEARHADGARRVVAKLAGGAVAAGEGVEWNDTTDVIGGSAGIGLFLLYAADALDLPDARQLAAKAGRRLLERAQPEHGGRKWPMNGTSPQRLPNFSHGTAGVAYFLATLYQATRERAFLDGALAGAAYLKAIAKTDGDMCLLFHHEPDADGRRLYYLGWCHGPAGTARLWYRLWEATGDRAWLDWAARSARAILASGIPDQPTPGFWNNVGQCCGSAGVAAFFLAHHRATGDAGALAFARRVSDQIASRATRDAAGARWVHAEHRVRPDETAAQTGWMQGAAGIGAWFLHLDAFERGAAPPIRFPDSPF